MTRGELDPLRDLTRTLNEQADHKPRPSVPKGGAKQDLTVIAGDNCWCGRDKDHDWLGREDGAPHPKYPE